MNECFWNSFRELRKQTTAGGTSVSSLTSGSSISAAESQSILSLLAASRGSTPVSVAFAYRDLLAFFFGASTYTTNRTCRKILRELTQLESQFYLHDTSELNLKDQIKAQYINQKDRRVVITWSIRMIKSPCPVLFFNKMQRCS